MIQWKVACMMIDNNDGESMMTLVLPRANAVEKGNAKTEIILDSRFYSL
jgi:hypothetical protein